MGGSFQARSLKRAAEQGQAVVETMPSRHVKCGAVGNLFATSRQRDKAHGQIAAVDGRDIARFEWGQSARVVPVEEMAKPTFEPVQRIQRLAHPHRKFLGTDMSEAPGSEGREHHHADIGGRSAVRGCLDRLFLVVVGR